MEHDRDYTLTEGSGSNEMKKRKYKQLLKQIRERTFRVTVPALDELEEHQEEVTVIMWSDVVDILWKHLRKKGRK